MSEIAGWEAGTGFAQKVLLPGTGGFGSMSFSPPLVLKKKNLVFAISSFFFSQTA